MSGVIVPSVLVDEHFYMFKSITVLDAGSRGFGAFATQDIPSGTRIVKVHALFTLAKNVSYLLPHDIKAPLHACTPDHKAKFFRLRTQADMPNHHLGKLLRQKGFASWDATSKAAVIIGSNSYGKGGRTEIYDLCCRFNHSCRPIAEKRRVTDQEALEVWTLSEFKAGQEITVCYDEDWFYFTTAERQRIFLASMSFVCECSLCVLPSSSAERLVSDLRRRLLRYLFIALHQQDASPGKHLPQKLNVKIVMDRMVNATRRLDETTRETLYNALYAMLADMEGSILDGKLAGYYTISATMLLHQANEQGLGRLPPKALTNYKAWKKRASQLSPLLHGNASQGLIESFKSQFGFLDSLGEDPNVYLARMLWMSGRG